MSTETGPDWIRPGAAVVLYSIGSRNGGHPYDVVATTIARVATKSFTVGREQEPRFPIDGCATRLGGTWGWTRHVVPADSDKAREVLDGLRRQKLLSHAELACDTWQRDHTQANRAALIAALQEIEDCR